MQSLYFILVDCFAFVINILFPEEISKKKIRKHTKDKVPCKGLNVKCMEVSKICASY